MLKSPLLLESISMVMVRQAGAVLRVAVRMLMYVGRMSHS
jgi:hypothetical protein